MLVFVCLTQKYRPRVVEHRLDDVVGEPGLPGAVIEHLTADVIELRVVDADHGPDIGQEALAGVDAAVGCDPGKLPDILVGIVILT